MCAWDNRSEPCHIAARIAGNHRFFLAAQDALCQALDILEADRRSPVLNDLRIIEVRRRATNCRAVHN
jgi:hypothetical protein